MKTFLTACPPNGKATSFDHACIIIMALYWTQVSVGLSWDQLVNVTQEALNMFLHKVNKRYFGILVHSGVASQKRKAGIYFKNWKWFGARRHVSSLVPPLCLGNRSRAWGAGGEKGVGERRGICSYDSPGLGRSSQGWAHSAKVKGEKRNGSPWPSAQLLLCLHAVCSPYETPLY